MQLMPGEFFEMPSAAFWMDLTTDELATYAYLRYRKNNRTHKCWPSYKTIGEAIGRSISVSMTFDIPLRLHP